ncbi:MAG: hypothetical protein AAB920_01710 [Patescibacteria group bacterium]
MKTLIEISALLGIPLSEVEEALNQKIAQKDFEDFSKAKEGSDEQKSALEKLNRGGLVRKAYESFGPDSEDVHH